MILTSLRARGRSRLWPALAACLTATALSLSAAPIAQAQVLRTPSPRPATYVTARNGAIVLISTGSGKVVRALTRAAPGHDDSQPYLADSGRSVAFVRSTGYCSTSILSVSIRGGATRTLVPATTGILSYPKLSRDAKLLAYRSNNCQAGRETLMIRTLRTGATHPLAAPGADTNDYTFTPDGHHVVVVIAGLHVRSVPVQARDVSKGRVLNVTDPGYLATRVTRIGGSRDLAVDEYSPATGKERVLRIDGRTGRRTVLVTIPSSEVGLEGIDFDASGRYLLMQGASGAIYTVSHGTAVPLGTNVALGSKTATW